VWIAILALVLLPITGFTQNSDWIPVDSIPPAYARTLRNAAAMLATRDVRLQLETLHELEIAIAEHDPLTARAVTPLLVDVANREHRIVSYPREYMVPPQTRVAALRMLAGLGGTDAIQQLHDSVLQDGDDSVRAYAALLLAATQPTSEGIDTISTALSRARALGTFETEVYHYLLALEVILQDPWVRATQLMVEELIGITGGPYSSRTRNKASMLLELLLDR